MDFYNQLLAQKLSGGGGGGGDKYDAFKSLVDGNIIEVTADMLKGVTTIRNYAFYYLANLTSIEIPNTVTSIGNTAFAFCSNLTSITVESETPPALNGNIFFGTSDSLVIYVPAASVDTYKAASGWSTYADRIQAIPSG